jgi:CRP-like cAMP-binding protein
MGVPQARAQRMLGIGTLGAGAWLLSAEAEFLRREAVREKAVGLRHDLLRQGDTPQVAHLLLSGHAYRYRLLDNGRRQITAILVPGDLCDLEAVMRGRAGYGVATFTNSIFAEIPREWIISPCLDKSVLQRTLLRCQLRDEAIAREWLVGLGQRTAVERLGHLFCELWVRLNAVGLVDGNSLELGTTQVDLADTIGITTIHTSRVLRDLREANLIRLERGYLTILNRGELERLSGFEIDYLQNYINNNSTD